MLLTISGTILKKKKKKKEKAIIYAQELQVEDFHASNAWFERWRSVIYLYK